MSEGVLCLLGVVRFCSYNNCSECEFNGTRHEFKKMREIQAKLQLYREKSENI